MDLFGFKRRKAEREAKANHRAAALESARRTTERPSPPPSARRDVIGSYPQPRRRRPEADAPDSLSYGGGIYPHGSGYGAGFVDNTPTDSGSHHTHSTHDSLGAAGSGVDFGGSSSSSDSGSSYSGE